MKKQPVKKKKVVAPKTLKVGKVAPKFTAIDDSGEKVSLASLKGKTVVLYFYPKDDTPGCTKEACDFRDSFTRLKKEGVVVLGVSKDSVKSHLKFKEKYKLPFQLLADEDGKLCQAYGVWKEKSMYGRKYMGIERSTFIIDSSGKIAKIFEKVSVTGHVDEILESL